MPRRSPTAPVKVQPSTADVTIKAFAQVFTSIVETFGWPGALIIFGAWFIVTYATAEQKQRIIETFILGTNIARIWPLLIMAATFVVTLIAQHRWYLKNLQALSREVDREGKVKSELQEELSNKQLQHANSTTKPRGR